MINTIVIPTVNIHDAECFYNAFLKLFGASKRLKKADFVLWKNRENSVSLGIQKVKNCTGGNNTIIGFAANSPVEVKLIYQAAIRFGALCGGKPKEDAFGKYAAYILDKDNNKLGIFYHNIKY